MRRFVSSALLAFFLGVPLNDGAIAGEVTLVLVLEPTKFSGKPWDFGPGADPILCISEGCYRSAGLDRPARYIAGKRALSPFAALNLGGKAGACTNRLGCVFRDVPLGDGPARATPIDVDIDRHDRLEDRFIAADRTCRVKNGDLTCFNGVYTREYSLWIVPEDIADEAGLEGLDYAMHEGMHAGRSRFAEEFLSQEREALPQRIAEFYRLVLGEEVDETCQTDAVVMAGTFRLVGIGTAPGSSAGTALERFIRQGADDGLLASIQTEPRVFWALQQAIDRLQNLVSVDDVARSTDFGGIRVVERAGRLILDVGWKVEQEARDLMDRCQGIDSTDLDSIFRSEHRLTKG
jgi:hypothetical protein